MARPFPISWPVRRPSRARQRPRALRDVLALDCELCEAGEAVNGRVAGEGSGVRLVRIERHGQRRRGFVVARAPVSRPSGTFSLNVPETALPSAVGDACAVHYVAAAEGADGTAGAELVVLATARLHFDCRAPGVDRLVASWDARHFHIELAAVDLRGGGAMHGRIHRHGSWPPGAIVVHSRCLECWRLTGLVDPRTPLWQHHVLWEQRRPVRTDPDACWAPFGFELPDGLPPAVEASTIAWRYELVAERSVRHWFNETAALTPLLHDGTAR